MEEVGQRQRLRDDHVGVGALDDHLVDLVDAPLAHELLAREDLLALAREELVEGVQVLVEHDPGRPEGVLGIEVEDVADAVEDERLHLALARRCVAGPGLGGGHGQAPLSWAIRRCR